MVASSYLISAIYAEICDKKLWKANFLFLNLYLFLLVRPRMNLNQHGLQRGSFKYMVVLSLAKTWLKTRIQQNHLIKYVPNLRILYINLGFPPIGSLLFDLSSSYQSI